MCPHSAKPPIDFRLRNDLYCVGWGVKLYLLTRYDNDDGYRRTPRNWRIINIVVVVIKARMQRRHLKK